jgi:hypothetical protein
MEAIPSSLPLHQLVVVVEMVLLALLITAALAVVDKV